MILFLPLSGAIFYSAHEDGVLNASVAVSAFLIGAGLMACPIAMLKLKDKPFFKQG